MKVHLDLPTDLVAGLIGCVSNDPSGKTVAELRALARAASRKQTRLKGTELEKANTIARSRGIAAANEWVVKRLEELNSEGAAEAARLQERIDLMTFEGVLLIALRRGVEVLAAEPVASKELTETAPRDKYDYSHLLEEGAGS